MKNPSSHFELFAPLLRDAVDTLQQPQGHFSPLVSCICKEYKKYSRTAPFLCDGSDAPPRFCGSIYSLCCVFICSFLSPWPLSDRGVRGGLRPPRIVHQRRVSVRGGLDGSRMRAEGLSPTLHRPRSLPGWQVWLPPGLDGRTLHHWWDSHTLTDTHTQHKAMNWGGKYNIWQSGKEGNFRMWQCVSAFWRHFESCWNYLSPVEVNHMFCSSSCLMQLPRFGNSWQFMAMQSVILHLFTTQIKYPIATDWIVTHRMYIVAPEYFEVYQL